MFGAAQETITSSIYVPCVVKFRDMHVMLKKLPIMLFSNAPDFTLLCPKYFPVMPIIRAVARALIGGCIFIYSCYARIIMLYHIQSRAQKTRTLFNLTFVVINLCYIAT